MSKLKALVVDDESLARRGLKLRLENIEGIEVVAECCNGREAIQAIPEIQPDVVFLDIQMPGLNGFDVVRGVQGEFMPMVIFVTAFDHYAVDAFDVHAVDYVLKPADEERLEKAIARAKERLVERDAIAEKEKLLSVITEISGKEAGDLEKWFDDRKQANQYPEKIAIKDGSKISLVLAKDIDWVDAAGDYMCVHANNEIHVMRITMKQLEKQLNPDVFQRIHRSTIVNLNRVEKICAHINGEYHLILNGGARLKMSRSYKDKVQHFM